MGSVARSILFHSDATQPYETVLISTGGNPCPLLTAVADEASIFPCAIVYSSQADNYELQMTMTDAVHGDDALKQDLYVVEIDPYTNKISQDGTIYDNTYADTDTIKVYNLRIGMEFWAKGSSLTAAQGEILVTAANGLLTNTADPDGVAIDIATPGFMALTALSSGTYIPVRYMGRVTFDKTA